METRLNITHETRYDFSNEVLLDPHYLRFKPRTTPYNQLVSHDLRITPTPANHNALSDAENNLVQLYHFHGIHQMLVIHAASEVVLSENNPYDFMVFPESYLYMPFEYSPMLKSVLGATLFSTQMEPSLMSYGTSIRESTYFKTVAFINALTEQIHADFTRESRLEGVPYEADQTFNQKRGSCRDLSWMQMQLLRNLGIAARFVSGYYFTGSESTAHELHAWIEAYIPGAGWLGFDPSHGGMAGGSHIPICSSAYYQHTMPVTGSFRGYTNSTMTTSLSIEKIE
jgi:transglutaminase-like putative cysteine protease